MEEITQREHKRKEREIEQKDRRWTGNRVQTYINKEREQRQRDRETERETERENRESQSEKRDNSRKCAEIVRLKGEKEQSDR